MKRDTSWCRRRYENLSKFYILPLPGYVAPARDVVGTAVDKTVINVPRNRLVHVLFSDD